MKISPELREYIVAHLALDISEFKKDPAGRAGVKGASPNRRASFIALEWKRLQTFCREMEAYGVEDTLPSLEGILKIAETLDTEK